MHYVKKLIMDFMGLGWFGCFEFSGVGVNYNYIYILYTRTFQEVSLHSPVRFGPANGLCFPGQKSLASLPHRWLQAPCETTLKLAR